MATPTLPPKTAGPTPATVLALEIGLSSTIAGQANAPEPFTFYEVLDAYLGFGGKGYPIEYGKTYCIAFTSSESLMSNEVTRSWVQKTTVLLQEMLRDFVVTRFKQGTLATLTEAELSAFAFKSHPRAYDRGGLGMVLLAAPHLVPVIATKPWKEFVPVVGDNVLATWEQVIVTTVGTGSGAAITGFVAVLGPAHTGLWQRAAARDGLNAIIELRAAFSELDATRRLLESGKIDNLVLLERTIRRIEMRTYPDLETQNQAKRLIVRIKQRKLDLMKTRYGALLDQVSGFAAPDVVQQLKTLTQGAP